MQKKWGSFSLFCIVHNFLYKKFLTMDNPSFLSRCLVLFCLLATSLLTYIAFPIIKIFHKRDEGPHGQIFHNWERTMDTGVKQRNYRSPLFLYFIKCISTIWKWLTK